MIRYPLFGALAQLVAHNTGSVGVRSSNLLCSTKKRITVKVIRFFCAAQAASNSLISNTTVAVMGERIR